eukprot:snap_masked-scaffold_24-processed-gene-0.32-mRNA-1 protein AED:1.00 eAED:1.00 QI:0/0/0/0/1/1/2/0/86
MKSEFSTFNETTRLSFPDLFCLLMFCRSKKEVELAGLSLSSFLFLPNYKPINGEHKNSCSPKGIIVRNVIHKETSRFPIMACSSIM